MWTLTSPSAKTRENRIKVAASSLEDGVKDLGDEGSNGGSDGKVSAEGYTNSLQVFGDVTYLPSTDYLFTSSSSSSSFFSTGKSVELLPRLYISSPFNHHYSFLPDYPEITGRPRHNRNGRFLSTRRQPFTLT